MRDGKDVRDKKQGGKGLIPLILRRLSPENGSGAGGGEH